MRDFDAILRGRHVNKGSLIIGMLQRMYVIHQYAGTSFYPDSIFTTLLHLDYLRRVDHPSWFAFLADANLMVEEHGEITLSLLSNAMIKSTHKSQFSAIKKAYVGVGAGAELSKENFNSLGLSTKNREHMSSERQHASTVVVMQAHLKSVASTMLTEEKVYVFVESTYSDMVTDKRIERNARLRQKYTPKPFFRAGAIVSEAKMNEHAQSLRRRYHDNTDHPEIGPYLRGIVGDDRYTENP